MNDIHTLPGAPVRSGLFTTWFCEDVKPARPGVYQRDYRSGAGVVRYALWTGYNWLVSSATPTQASSATEVSHVRVPWRGLSEPVNYL